jgi:hypothetical protein
MMMPTSMMKVMPKKREEHRHQEQAGEDRIDVVIAQQPDAVGR